MTKDNEETLKIAKAFQLLAKELIVRRNKGLTDITYPVLEMIEKISLIAPETFLRGE